jgi:ABC-type dipeptide/oligopeptide/nickel transport system permease subunit
VRLVGREQDGRVWTLLALALLVFVRSAAAQVGLASNPARITLVAQVPARASMEEAAIGQTRVGAMQETTLTVHLDANSSYRVVVRGTDSAGRRVWVRAADGSYHPLVRGASVTVLQKRSVGKEGEQKIWFRTESDSTQSSDLSPPVRYEVVVDPIL